MFYLACSWSKFAPKLQTVLVQCPSQIILSGNVQKKEKQNLLIEGFPAKKNNNHFFGQSMIQFKNQANFLHTDLLLHGKYLSVFIFLTFAMFSRKMGKNLFH